MHFVFVPLRIDVLVEDQVTLRASFFPAPLRAAGREPASRQAPGYGQLKILELAGLQIKDRRIRRATGHDQLVAFNHQVALRGHAAHRVRAVGDRAAGLRRGMTLESRLEHLGGERWRVQDGDTTIGELAWPALRISVSWKAIVFADAAEEQAYDEHTSDLRFHDVLDRFEADLDARGIRMPRPAEPSHDEAFIDVITDAYVAMPVARA